MVSHHRHIDTALFGRDQSLGHIGAGQHVRRQANRTFSRANGAQYQVLRRTFWRKADFNATRSID